jgi:hypothetical protein
MRRRDLLALLAVVAAAPGEVMAANVQTFPIDKAFPFLAAYLALPAAARSRFYLAYRSMRDKHPISDGRATIVAPGGARTPVAFDRVGEVTRLPSLAELKSGANVEVDGAPFQLGLELRCAIASATRLDVVQLSLALDQVNQAAARFAGPLSLVIPKFTAAYFPDAGSAQVVMGDGRATALPVVAVPNLGPVPYIEPSALVGARTVQLARAPSRILLGAHPKKT